MRKWLIALLFVASVAAQPTTLDEPGLRVAFGDNPSTPETEASGAWNFQELIRLEAGSHQLDAPNFARSTTLLCEECTFVRSGAGFNVTVTNTTDVKLAYQAAGGTPFSVEHDYEGLFVLYAPTGTHIQSSINLQKVGVAASDPSLELYSGNANGAFWFIVSPIAPETVTVSDSSFDFTALAIGIIGGIALWAFLVKGGFVQKRQRKQVAATAVHKEVAKKETPEALEGRKRVLMAALKELEVAKMNQDIETEAYDTLKADFKKQTVTVMRALEEAKAE